MTFVQPATVESSCPTFSDHVLPASLRLVLSCGRWNLTVANVVDVVVLMANGSFG